MCSCALTSPPPTVPIHPSLPPSPSCSLPERFFSIDALTVKCSLCLHCWPHQLGQSLMTHYTHINRTKHKQSSQSCCIRLHIQHSRVSLGSLYLCFSLSPSPPSLSFSLPLFISLSMSPSNTHTHSMDARRTNRTLRRCNFWKWKWKLAPIRETNKVTSVLYVCQVVEGIQLENIELHPAFRLSSR